MSCCCPLAVLANAVLFLSSWCPLFVPLLSSSCGLPSPKTKAAHSVRPRRQTLSGCPFLFLLSKSVRSSLPHVLSLLFCSNSPLGVLPSCCPAVLLAVSATACLLVCGGFVLLSFPHPFVLCVLCCPSVVLLITLLSEVGLGLWLPTTSILAD